MADATNPEKQDIISLDDVFPDDPASAGATDANNDSILSAAHVFEEQLEQMTAWKHQLAQQMEVLRRDGIRVLERQKNLAIERKKLTEDRAQVTADRHYVQQLHRELEAETTKLTERAATFELTQAALDTTAQTLAQREAELRASESALQEREIRFLEQDVQLKSTLEQLEAQRQQLFEAQRHLHHEQEVLHIHQQDIERAAKSDQHLLNDRWTAIESRAAEITALEQSAAQKLADLTSREQQLAAEKQSLEEAQQALQAQHDQIAQAEKALEEKRTQSASDLALSSTAVESLRAELDEERQTLRTDREKLQSRIDTLENEYAEQLESLAQQSKKLTQRRAEIEARITDIQKEADARIARSIASSSNDQSQAQTQAHDYETQLATLRAELQQNAQAESEWKTRETELRSHIENANTTLASLQEQITTTTDQLAAAAQDRTNLARQLAEQTQRHEEAAAQWQSKLTDSLATASSTTNSELNQLTQQSAQTQHDIEQLRTAHAELQSTHAQTQTQLASALSSQDDQTASLANQLSILEAQRNDLIEQLYAGQDALRRQSEEATLAKSALEADLAARNVQLQNLEAEKSAWQSQPVPTNPQSSVLSPQHSTSLSVHRSKLIRQARTVRMFRKQIRDSKSTLEKNRTDIATQREQLRTRKDNLEQVKRLLEKQEMVMARKLADHNALKTVAAVGIFVIMILGSVFFGVYRFVTPNYTTQAVVQLAPPPAAANGAPLQGADLQNWLVKQSDFVRSPEVTFAAWKILRAPEEHYSMQDVREEWLASLPKNLALSVDPATRTLAIQYTGQNPEGVAQVANALAAAFAAPTSRENNTPQTVTIGAGANVAAKAITPTNPIDDNRLMISLSGVAIVLFISLILVILFRHYVARQLREIDDMADEKDLDDIAGDLPTQPAPT